MATRPPTSPDGVAMLALAGLVLFALVAGVMAVFLGNTIHVAVNEWQGLWALLGKG